LGLTPTVIVVLRQSVDPSGEKTKQFSCKPARIVSALVGGYFFIIGPIRSVTAPSQGWIFGISGAAIGALIIWGFGRAVRYVLAGR